MKTSDYISVGVIAIVGTVIAYFLMNSLLGDPSELSKSFEYMETVGNDLVEPDPNIFHQGAINPTVEVYVGNCKDSDQDGVLSERELIECGAEQVEVNALDSGYTSESGITEAENRQQNIENGLAPSTSESQRANTLEQIESHEEEVRNQNTQAQNGQTGDEAARQETTSVGN